MKTKLTQVGYCGMESIPVDCEDEKEGRFEAAKLIRRRRKQGFHVVKLGRHSWEVLEPENSVMVPDQAGFIDLEKEATRECFYCGCDYFPSENPDGCDCMNPIEDEEIGNEI